MDVVELVALCVWEVLGRCTVTFFYKGVSGVK